MGVGVPPCIMGDAFGSEVVHFRLSLCQVVIENDHPPFQDTKPEEQIREEKFQEKKSKLDDVAERAETKRKISAWREERRVFRPHCESLRE